MHCHMELSQNCIHTLTASAALDIKFFILFTIGIDSNVSFMWYPISLIMSLNINSAICKTDCRRQWKKKQKWNLWFKWFDEVNNNQNSLRLTVYWAVLVHRDRITVPIFCNQIRNVVFADMLHYVFPLRMYRFFYFDIGCKINIF